MKVTILSEDNAPEGLVGEHGFSAFIEFNGKNILFDTGQSGSFIENAKKLGKDLSKTDFVVISHGHWDHTGGLPHLIKEFDTSNMTFVSHPGIFETKLHGSTRPVIGCPVSHDDIDMAFKTTILTNKAFEFMPGVTFLGEVPRTFEDPGTVGDHVVEGKEVPDPVKDDSALVFETDNGLVLLTGCSHSGILNLVKTAEKMGDLDSVIGGFHLKKASDERINKVLKEFSSIKEVYTCHCTGRHVVERLGAKGISVGDIIE